MAVWWKHSIHSHLPLTLVSINFLYFSWEPIRTHSLIQNNAARPHGSANSKELKSIHLSCSTQRIKTGPMDLVQTLWVRSCSAKENPSKILALLLYHYIYKIQVVWVLHFLPKTVPNKYIHTHTDIHTTHTLFSKLILTEAKSKQNHTFHRPRVSPNVICRLSPIHAINMLNNWRAL
jgi:hypothetical protein